MLEKTYMSTNSVILGRAMAIPRLLGCFFFFFFFYYYDYYCTGSRARKDIESPLVCQKQ